MASEQLALDLNTQLQSGFIEGVANAAAMQAMRTENKLLILGEPRSGKSQILQASLFLHLRSIEDIDHYLAKGIAQDCAIDDAHHFAKNAQSALFHLYNFQQENGTKLVLCSSLPLSQWGIDLPDLKSRLETFTVAEIEAPDDMMVVQILAKMFHNRGVIVSHDLVEYAAKRVERSYVAIENAVIGIDQLAAQKHKVTKKLAKQYFEALHE